MKTLKTSALSILAMAGIIGITGCSGMSTQNKYMVGGAAVGGLIGNEVGKNK